MKLVIAIALLAAACSKKDSSGGSECESAVARGVEQTIAKRRGSNAGEMSPAEQEVPTKLKAVLSKACTDDKWSKDVLDCFKTAEDIKICKDKLTPEQRANYTRNVMQVMMGSRPGGGGMGHGGPMMGSGAEPPAPPATPPTGSGSN